KLAAWAFLQRVPAIRDGTDAQQIARAIDALCIAARLSPHEKLTLSIEARIRGLINRIADRKVDWQPLAAKYNPKLIEKAVVLKPFVSEREPGVVFVSFEYQWVRL